MALKDIYFTISEAAKEFNVSRQTIYRWIEDEKITIEKVGGVTLIDKPAIQKYAARKSLQSFSHMMDMYLLETIREQCGYRKNDVIEEDKKGGMDFIVTQKDGAREKVHVGGIEITLAMYEKDKSPIFKNMKLKNVTSKKYKGAKHTKDDKTISKPETRAKEAK